MGPESYVGFVPIKKFSEMPPEAVGKATLRQVLWSCAEHHPEAIPVQGVCVRVALDVVETTDDSIESLEIVGLQLIQILIEASGLIEGSTTGNGRQSIKIHPEYIEMIERNRHRSQETLAFWVHFGHLNHAAI